MPRPRELETGSDASWRETAIASSAMNRLVGDRERVPFQILRSNLESGPREVDVPDLAGASRRGGDSRSAGIGEKVQDRLSPRAREHPSAPRAEIQKEQRVEPVVARPHVVAQSELVSLGRFGNRGIVKPGERDSPRSFARWFQTGSERRSERFFDLRRGCPRGRPPRAARARSAPEGSGHSGRWRAPARPRRFRERVDSNRSPPPPAVRGAVSAARERLRGGGRSSGKAGVPEEGRRGRLAPAELLEHFHRGLASAESEDGLAKATAGLGDGVDSSRAPPLRTRRRHRRRAPQPTCRSSSPRRSPPGRCARSRRGIDPRESARAPWRGPRPGAARRRESRRLPAVKR